MMVSSPPTALKEPSKVNPSYKIQHKNIAKIKATIWLDVIADVKIPTETKVAPNKINPIYEVRVAPPSITPTG